MFFKKKKEDDIINEINSLGGTMQPLNPMQGMPDMNASSGMEPIPSLESSGSLDMPPMPDFSPENNVLSNNSPSIPNPEFNANIGVNDLSAPLLPSNGDLSGFDGDQPVYQEQQSPSQGIKQRELNQSVQGMNNNLQSNLSQDLPSFEKASDKLDLLVPAPPPNLLQRDEFSIDSLEEVEREFKSINSIDDYQFEKKEVNSKEPIFIKIKNYEITLKNIIDMKNNAKEFSEVMFRLENIDDSQNSKFNSLQNQVEDIQRKLIFIDNLIFEVQK